MPLRVSILSIMCTNDVHEHTGFAYTLLFISKNEDEQNGGTVDCVSTKAPDYQLGWAVWAA